jgi:aerobic C4-dicarboxylate transport protein
VIAIIFGLGLMALKPEKRIPIQNGLNTISTAFFEFIHIIMSLAPIGTFGAVAYAVGSNGTAVLFSLAYFVLTFYVLVIIFIVVVLGAVCALFRINLFHLLRYIRDEIFIMLGTPPRKAFCRVFWKNCRLTAPQSKPLASCFPPGTPSTSTAPRCSCRWALSSLPMPMASHSVGNRSLAFLPSCS